jgi:hypothetical protein
MAKIEAYREKVRQIISGYAQRLSSANPDEVETIFDPVNDHYLLLEAGWRGEERDYGSLIHFDIKGGKIWIQHDGTEAGLANELLALGVPKDDIVLGFHSPFMRQHTEFATG